jgi:enhancing lycopene biosynthesis protein 2
VGSTSAASPYDIGDISDGMTSIGAEVQMKTVEEVSVDKDLKIVCGPCYMMEADIVQVNKNAEQVVDAVASML